MYKWIFLSSCLVLVGCKEGQKAPQNEFDVTKDVVRRIEIAPETKPCQGIAVMPCLQVRTLDKKEWTLFYSPIEGFHYQEGYRYVVDVKATLKPKPVPADASTIEWTLIRIVSQQKEKSNTKR